jgi:hypothetical protein
MKQGFYDYPFVVNNIFYFSIALNMLEKPEFKIKRKVSRITTWVDRLSYMHSAAMFLFAMGIATIMDYFNKPISCITPAELTGT